LLCNFLHSPVTSSHILLSTLFPNTLSLCSCLNVRDQLSKHLPKHFKLLSCLLHALLQHESHIFLVFCVFIEASSI
jgi:hypothetical protein